MVYRDIAALQASRVPIEGAAGLAMAPRCFDRGLDVHPPKRRHVHHRRGRRDRGRRAAVAAARDPELQAGGAERARQSVGRRRRSLAVRSLLGAGLWCSTATAIGHRPRSLAQLRTAIRDNRKLAIAYVDEEGRRSQRTIWPIAIAYYVDATLVGAWCELRRDFRHFRVDRIQGSQLLEDRFPPDNGRLMAEWLALRKERPDRPAPR